ncbi:MAG TPA: histidine kinase [Opitutae bacterium]|nr:histidine kinase [Opitutaceae bacterium]HCR29927.1 histidine kinase [Opitutae bacterium]
MKQHSKGSETEDPNLLLSLYRISQAGSVAFNVREAYQAIMEAIQVLLQPTSASIALISPDTGLLEIEYALGYPSNLDDYALHLGKGISGRVAFKGESMLVADVENSPYYVKLLEDVRCKMAVPLFSEGQIIGVISVESRELARYKDQDVSRLQSIADEAVRSLQCVWRQRQLKNQSEQLNALIEVGQKVVSNLEIQNLWESITKSALGLTGARMSTLQLFDKKQGLVTMEAVRPSLSAFQSRVETLPIEESMSASAIQTRKQIEFPNITTPDYLDLLDTPQQEDVVSCLSTPMIYEGEVIGVINIFTQVRHRFPNEEKRLLRAFASLSAAAAQNANLYARVFNSEDLLRKSERLTTLGLLSAEIAHEIRNPLTVIKLLFGSLDLQYDSADPRAKDTQIIKEKINQLEEIVSRVLSFGKNREGLYANCPIDELISDTLILVRLKMSQQRIELRHEKLEHPLEVYGNKGQLQQVFLNLILNASEAMPNGGKLTISTNVEDVSGNRRLTIYFQDTGSGIPESIQDRIFDSFLTDKPEGTGLGLSIVKRILRSHRGDISVAESSDKGSILRIELPIGSD